MPNQQRQTSRPLCFVCLLCMLPVVFAGCVSSVRHGNQHGQASASDTDAGGVDRYRRGDTVAVLLPQAGRFAEAARAIRDGLLAAQRTTDEAERLQLRFYDTSDAQDALEILRRAATDGARLAIGPLQKGAVNQLAVASSLPMATLALNSPQGDALPPENLYRYALDPEDQAKDVARAARAKGFSSALIIYPDSAWGTRIARAFMNRWAALGGVLEAGQSYNAETYNFSESLDKLFQVSEYAPTSTRWGTEADFIFLVGKAHQAREIWPQVHKRVADHLPVFCTSHIYDGRFQNMRNDGLVGLYFVDIPWMVTPLRGRSASLKGIRHGPRSSDGYYQRLFAMGLDAYRLAPVVAGSPQPGKPLLDGQTGVLSIDGLRRIRRQLPLVRVGSKGFSALTQQ